MPLAARDNKDKSSRWTAFGRKALNLTKSSTRGADRQSKILSIKAAIEKKTRVDLPPRIRNLGRAAYKHRVLPDLAGPLHDAIAEIEVEIDEKRERVSADRHGPLFASFF